MDLFLKNPTKISQILKFEFSPQSKGLSLLETIIKNKEVAKVDVLKKIGYYNPNNLYLCSDFN
jgi:hypothetical protein